MSTTKRLVCLANSQKMSGRCVAGKELESGSWIRPVSSRNSEEVSEDERRYSDGTDPKVLDIVDVPLLEPRPHDYQTENWLLDPENYWTKVGELDRDSLGDLVEDPPALWINGHSSQVGRNDRVPEAEAGVLRGSLHLLTVQSGEVRVSAPGAAFGNPKRRVQLRFEHGGVDYALWVTDPSVRARYLQQEDGTFMFGGGIVTISLGEPIRGFAYKLVATMIDL